MLSFSDTVFYILRLIQAEVKDGVKYKEDPDTKLQTVSS